MNRLFIACARPADVVSRSLDDYADWHIEPKVDGKRLLIIVGREGEQECYSRHGTPVRVELPYHILRKVPEETVFDCEHLSKTGEVIAFDVPIVFGHYNAITIEERRRMLEHYFPEIGKFRRIARVPVKGAAALRWALERGHEGIVLKQPFSVYPMGDTRAWLKCKR